MAEEAAAVERNGDDQSETSDYTSEDEGTEDYRRGGYHAVRIGDTFRHGRYVVQSSARVISPSSGSLGPWGTHNSDHLALTMELLGMMPRKVALGGHYSQELFNRYGDLRRIRRLKFWRLNKVIREKYEFSEQDANDQADFLVQILNFVPEKRPTAAQFLNHPWISAGTKRLTPSLSQLHSMGNNCAEKKREKDEREAMEDGIGNIAIDGAPKPVSITPEVTSKKVCREIMGQLIKTYGASHLSKRMLAYDGRKIAYSAAPLPFTSMDFVVKLIDKDGSRRERDFKVSIKYASTVDPFHLKEFIQGRLFDAPQETIQALDIVLREKPSINYKAAKRSFFPPQLGGRNLGDGLVCWKGFYQSLRPTQMGLSLNVDMFAEAFYEPILVSDFVAKYLRRDLTMPLSSQDRIKVKRTLTGLRVELNHTERVKHYKISGVSIVPAQQLMFVRLLTGKGIHKS